MILIRRPWTRQPQVSVAPASWGFNSLLTGANAQPIAEAGVGAGINTVFGSPFTLSGAGGFSASVGPEGRSLRNTGTTSYLYRTNPVTSGPRSIGLVFVPASTDATRGLWSIANTTTSGLPRMLLQANNADLRLFVGGEYKITLTGVVQSERPLSVVVTIDDVATSSAFTVTLAANGVAGTATGTHTASYLDTNEYLFSGYSTSGLGRLALFVGANTRWPDAAQRSLSLWQTAFAPLQTIIHHAVAAGGTPTLTALTASAITTSGATLTITA